MKAVKVLWTALLAVLVWIGCISAVPVYGAAKESVSSPNDACKGVVRMIAVFSDEGKIGSGTGFGVGRTGEETDTFITNWHVVTDEETGAAADAVFILIGNDAVRQNSQGEIVSIDTEQMIPCEVLYKTTGYPDFAIIKADRKVEGRIALPLMPSENASRGDEVFALGFPGSSDLANGHTYYAALVEDVTLSSGTISRFTEMNISGDTMVIQHKAEINNGNSGGPLVTEDGTVIGINTYGFGEAEMEHSAAVYVDYAMDQMDQMGIYFEIRRKGSSNIWMYVLGGTAAGVTGVSAVWYVRSGKAGKPYRHRGQADVNLRLQGISGVFVNRRFAVGSKVRIGRDRARNDLVYPENTPGISSAHCELAYNGRQIFICDVGSTYGTFVNGRRIESNQAVSLQVGDVFYLADPKESFRIELKN